MRPPKPRPLPAAEMASESRNEQNVCRVFPVIKEVRAYVKQVEETGDHGKEMFLFDG